MDLRSLSNELVNPKVLICPGDDRTGVDRRTITWERVSPDLISYEYLACGANETKLDANEVVLRCLIHGTEAYADGSVHQTQAPRRR